jgi:SAM-dependent methyltransferase
MPDSHFLTDFLDYWETEGAAHSRKGDYDWMAAQIPEDVERVLEIGCGPGFGTLALAKRGFGILTLDFLPACLAAARARLDTITTAASPIFLEADLAALPESTFGEIAAFRPDAVLCWLMGAPQNVMHADESRHPQEESRPQDQDQDQNPKDAVARYRERMQRHAAQLAARLPEARYVHLVDRTVVPWQGKDLGREVLVRHHLSGTFADLPFDAAREDARYRKLDPGGNAQGLTRLRHAHPSMKSVALVLASLLARRKTQQEPICWQSSAAAD